MSNLSDIGFPAKGDEEINSMIISVLDSAVEMKCPDGFYLRFSDPSGSELYLQGNPQQEMIGFNPHFAGASRRGVSLVRSIARETSELDGAYLAAVGPDGGGPLPGALEFIFDVPDFRVSEQTDLPARAVVQLTAFASDDFRLLHGTEELAVHPPAGKWEAGRFIPPGLKELLSDPGTDIRQMRPVAKMTGTVRSWELKRNGVTGREFYWILIETEGGEVDVVVDPRYVPEEPSVGQIAAGHFWLSGRLVG